MSKLVSIIVPVYNCESFLPRTLESICEQSYGDLDIILVDDGSDDKSGVICDEICARDQRFKVIHQKNKGPGGARNSGLLMAKGDYIGFIDGGDYIHAKTIELLLTALEESTADFSMSEVRYTDHLSEDIHYPFIDIRYEVISQQEMVFNLITNYRRLMLPWASVCNKLYRRCLIDNILFKDIICNEDHDFNLRTYLKSEKCIYIREPLYYYVQIDGSIVHSPETKPKRLYVHTESRYQMIKYFHGPTKMKYEGWLLDYLYRDLLDRKKLLRQTSVANDFKELSISILKDSIFTYLINPYIPFKKKIKFLLYWIWKK